MGSTVKPENLVSITFNIFYNTFINISENQYTANFANFSGFAVSYCSIVNEA